MGYNIHWQQGYIMREFESLDHALEVAERIKDECDCFCVEVTGTLVEIGVETEKHVTRMDDQYRHVAAEGFEGYHVLIGEDGCIWAEVVGHGVHEAMTCEIIVATAYGKRLPAPAGLRGVKA